MVEKGWNWNDVKNNYWQIPDEYMYYLVKRWSNKNKPKILDLGCGVGRHALLFAKNYFDVTAVDISQSGLNKLNVESKRENLNIVTMLANVTCLPLENNEMDYAIAFNSIYHTDEKGFEKAINEMIRVVKPKGEVFLSLLSKNDQSYENAQSEKIIGNNTIMKMEEDGTELPHFYVNYEDIQKIFKKYKIISIKEITEFFNNKRHVHFNILINLEEKR